MEKDVCFYREVAYSIYNSCARDSLRVELTKTKTNERYSMSFSVPLTACVQNVMSIDLLVSR